MEQLFTQALGLTSPWAVTAFDFRQSDGAIHFRVECQASRLPYPACSAADQPIRDRIERRWQHLHFFQFKAFIDARLPRVACSVCGKTSQAPVPWSRAGSGFSLVLTGTAQEHRALEPPADRADALAAAQRPQDRASLASERNPAWRLPEQSDPGAGCGRAAAVGPLGAPLPVAPFKRLGATVRDQMNGIVEHVRSGLSNGFVEAMNAQIQAAKARAKGEVTTDSMVAIAYLLCAKLKHLPRNPRMQGAAT